MTTNLKAVANIGLAGVVLVLLASEAEARQLDTYPVFGVSFRNGDTFAVEPGIVHFGAPAESGRLRAAMARGVVGIGGCGGGLGLVTSLWPSPGPHDARDLYYEGIVILEARVERMYGSTSWQHTTYAGPQLSVVLPIIPKVSLGWMIDVRDAADNHVQVGLGFGL
jgi:hypothetical protein